MRRTAFASLLMMSCCAISAQLHAAPIGNAKQSTVSLAPNNPGYIAEDPILAKLVGKPAPALTLNAIDGKSVNLKDFYGKQPVYLKLWATYCIPCRVQMPGLRKIFGTYGREMTVIAVNAGVGDDTEKVKQFAQDYGLHMPVTIDDGRLGAWIGMKATPVHIVVGRDGRVIFAAHQDGPKLDAAINQALASKASPAGVATTRLADLVTLKPGDLVPAIELQSADGKRISLPAGPSARPRAIYFSATWCESYLKSTQLTEAAKCKVGREQVDKLVSEHPIEWFGVMSHMWTTAKDLAEYESEKKPRLPLAIDTTGAAFRAFGVKRFPAIALIDTGGRLIKLVEGNPNHFPTEISSIPIQGDAR